MNVRLLPVCLFAAAAAAQDVVLYKFDDDLANEVINYAYGSESLGSNGVLESNTGGSALGDGRFRAALQGGDPVTGRYNRVRTGWTPSARPLTGDLTLSFWMRLRTPSANIAYLCGTTLLSGSRLFTGGPAGHGLYMLGVVTRGGNGGAQGDLVLPARAADIQARAAAGWVHVALVVDAAAATAQWYVDGQSVLLLRNVGPARINSGGEFLIGFQGTRNVSNYDLDEFLLSKHACTAAEVQALAGAPRAGEGDYTSGVANQCGTATLHSYGGAPVLGNRNYGLELDAPAQGIFFLGMGHERTSFRGKDALPLEIPTFAPGCWLLTDVASLRAGKSRGQPIRVAAPIPTTVSALDLQVFAQGVVLNLGGRDTVDGANASMGLAIAVGY